MPSFKIHNKWAEMLGISKSISNEVNKIIDLKYEREHDWYRTRQLEIQNLRISKEVAKPLLFPVWSEHLNEIYANYGLDGVEALFLHAMLDYLNDHLLLKEDIEFAISFGAADFSDEFEYVRNFVLKNMEDIKKDIQSQPNFQKRLEKSFDFGQKAIESRGKTFEENIFHMRAKKCPTCGIENDASQIIKNHPVYECKNCGKLYSK